MYQSQSRPFVHAGIPSSISRDLRSTAATPKRTPPIKTSSSSSPIVEASDGALSKVYGSLVEPESQRQQWACHGCDQIFHRDATIYVAPSSQVPAGPLAPSALVNRERVLQGGSQDHYCRQCYSSYFSMGSCVACQKSVLGSTKEDGKYVKASNGDIWHGRCWTCVHCGEKDHDKLSVGLTGLATCEECFDRTPAQRKHVKEQASTERRGRRVSPNGSTSALSGSANRTGMGATIAELSSKFGKPVPMPPPSPFISSPSESNRGSPELKSSHSRSNSLTGRIRPLTAQFSGQSFNLAAFQPSTPILSRSDSRSRSLSPHKASTKRVECAKCLRGPFEGPGDIKTGDDGATMITIPREDRQYHLGCFLCSICSSRMDDSTRSFVRLGEGSFAHPHCAPPVSTLSKRSNLPLANCAMTPSTSFTKVSDHATHQRETRPSISKELNPDILPISYLSGPSTESIVSHTPRRFQSSAGAAPPTRSTLVHQRPSTNSSMASLAMSSSTRLQADKFSKLGGMSNCGGCSLTVSTLEGIPGPRGIRWHKKCLVCSSKSRGKMCGKLLDSSARVDEQGQVRCRQCFDCEHSRHSPVIKA